MEVIISLNGHYSFSSDGFSVKMGIVNRTLVVVNITFVLCLSRMPSVLVIPYANGVLI